MRELLITLFAMSSVDSLNPIGITQQFILQGLVKKPRHIWYFIITTGVVNMIFGYLVYYGAMAIISSGISHVVDNYGIVLYLLEMALGVSLLIWSGISLAKRILGKRNGGESGAHAAEEEKIRSRVRSVTPVALITVGVVSTVSELTSAVPYFSFLAVLLNYKLSFLVLTLILILYNIIYILPFAILYVVYIVSINYFNKIYDFFRNRLKRVIGFLVPVLVLAIAVFVLYDATANLISL